MCECFGSLLLDKRYIDIYIYTNGKCVCHARLTTG